LDRELVARAQRGDEAAFAKLIDRFGDRLYAVARRVLRSAGRSDDAVWQAPIDIWRILPTVRDPDRLISFRNVSRGRTATRNATPRGCESASVAADGSQSGTMRPIDRPRGMRKPRRPLEIAPNVFEIVLGRVRVHLIAEETLTLIDCGLPGSSTSIHDAIAAIGRTPSELRRIVCTHAHFDHAGGAAEIAAGGDVEVLMHAADLASVRTTLADVARRPGRRLFVALTPQLDRATPLADNDVVPTLGGLRVVHVPGHTPGSICLHAPATGLLFVGDALQARLGKVGFASRLYSDDWHAACRAVKRLAALDVNAIVFGHYPVQRDDPNGLLRRLAAEAEMLDRPAYEEGTR